MKEFFEAIAGLLIIYLFIKVIQFLVSYPLLGFAVLLTVLVFVIRAVYKKESEKAAQKRAQEEQDRIKAERGHAALIEEQEKQRRIIDLRQQIDEMKKYQLDILPFICMLDTQGRRNQAFTHMAAKCRNFELKAKRESERINREATVLGIQERANVLYR